MEPDQQDDIDLRQLFSVLWSSRLIVIAVTFLGAIVSAGYSLTLPNMYHSSALLSPAEESGSSAGGMLAQYSGLASLAGISLGGGDTVSRTKLAIEVLKSRAFTKEFINKRGILPDLLALKDWDPSSREAVYNLDLYNPESKKWTREVRAPWSSTPSDQEAFKEFSKIFAVDQNQTTKLVTISIVHRSPDIARQWVEWLIDDINEAMRKKDVKEAEESIGYLRKQAAENTVADLDKIFFELMQAQMQRRMLAEVRREYVLTTIDPAVSPALKAEPNRALIVIIGTITAGAFCLFLLISKFLYSREDRLTK